MKQYYKIDNEVIFIAFESNPGENIRTILKQNGFKWNPTTKEWSAPYSKQLETHAKELGCEIISCDEESVKQSEPEIRPSTMMVTQPNTLERELDRRLSESPDENITQEEFNNFIYRNMEEDVNIAISPLLGYKQEIKDIDQQRKQYSDQHPAFKEFAERKKVSTNKKEVLENAVIEYMLSKNLNRIKSRDTTILLTKTKIYEFDEEGENLVEDGLRRMGLPAWLQANITIINDEIEKMDYIPVGIVQKFKYGLKYLDNLSQKEELALQKFLEGESIQNIAADMEIIWLDVWHMLSKALVRGELNIIDYASDSTIEKVRQFHQENPEITRIKDFYLAFDKKIPIDIMSLILSFLHVK